jgi:GntR family transcriptional regulator
MENRNKHQEIKEYIIGRINRKEIVPSDPIESENELASKFNVSRMTARKVVDELVVLGVLTRYHGKGTFVSERPKFKDLQSFLCFTEEAMRRGLSVTNRIIDYRRDNANANVAFRLNISTSKQVWYIRRVRNVDGEPYAYEDSAYLASYFGECSDEILRGSVYYHLERKVGLVITYANQTIEAVVADEKLSDLLEVPVGFPLLKITMVSYLKNGAAFEFTTTYYRSDRFSITQSAYRTTMS